MHSAKKSVQSLSKILRSKGINQVVISPGSRNAALSIEFEHEDDFECYSIVDERSAGFFALGIAQQSQKPCVLLCTSGSALLNYYPAVAEAYYQRIPLILISADRPIEWIDQGDGQTIRQDHTLAKHCLKSVSLSEDFADPDMVWHNEYLMNAAINASMGDVNGPVHINFPLRENLYLRSAENNAPGKHIEILPVERRLSKEHVQELVNKIEQSPRVLVLCGMLPHSPELNEALVKWSKLPQVLIMTESTSNLQSSAFIPCIDRMISGWNDVQMKAFSPDILISIGHSLVSKRIKSLLRRYRPAQHWHIDLKSEAMDTFQSLTLHIPVMAKSFFELVLPEAAHKESQYGAYYRGLDQALQKQSAMLTESMPFCDLSVFARITSSFPDNSYVQMGNSSVVRYFQLYPPKPRVVYHSNRGASGIDGCSSTAVGAAVFNKEITTLVTGDIAFFYDQNAFWSQHLPKQLKVILVNNGGGGIFRIIDGPAQSGLLEKHFETQHHRTAEKTAAQYGLGYLQAHDFKSLEDGLKWLYQQTACAMLEIFTPREENDQYLKDFFSNLKA